MSKNRTQTNTYTRIADAHKECWWLTSQFASVFVHIHIYRESSCQNKFCSFVRYTHWKKPLDNTINGSSVYDSKFFVNQNTQVNLCPKFWIFFTWLNHLSKIFKVSISLGVFIAISLVKSERHFVNYERIFIYFKSKVIFLVFFFKQLSFAFDLTKIK